MRRLLIVGLVLLVSIGTACTSQDTDQPVPTVANLDTLPTAIFLTENAPPQGFGTVNVDPIDANLSDHQGWSYTMSGSFEGTFDDTGDPAAGSFEAQVWANELGEARRAVLQVEGAALSPDESPRRLEGVRLSNDFYIVDTNGTCTPGGEGASVIADLSAGQIVGGVTQAVPTGHQQDIDSVRAWQYTFAPDAVRLPALHREANSTVAIDADLWIGPSVNAVLRFDLSVQIAHVRVLWAERSVSGTLSLHYDLLVPTLDTLPNISIPHGC